jgi:isopentenyl-diphosphate delta-isomerase
LGRLTKRKTLTRKADHIKICLKEEVEARETTSGFEEVYLIHDAIPESSLEEIDCSVNLFGFKLSMPLIISAMTGGTRLAFKINAALAEAAESMGVALTVGSQRAALESPEQAYTFKVAREKAPNILLIANLGAAQLVRNGVEAAVKAVEMIKADALSIHLNALQEAVQLEGETGFRGFLEKLKELKHTLNMPILVKETGAGISAEAALKFREAGVEAVDVGGAGDTSWAAVEYYRAKASRNRFKQKLCEVFWDWGIPTAVSVVEASKVSGLTVIATGGIRSGIDMAKAIALGATATGVALPLLKPAVRGSREVIKALETFKEEFRVALHLTGARKPPDLQRKPVVIIGKTAEWLRNRGFNPEEYAKRGH